MLKKYRHTSMTYAPTYLEVRRAKRVKYGVYTAMWSLIVLGAIKLPLEVVITLGVFGFATWMALSGYKYVGMAWGYFQDAKYTLSMAKTHGVRDDD